MGNWNLVLIFVCLLVAAFATGPDLASQLIVGIASFAAIRLAVAIAAWLLPGQRDAGC